MTIIHGIYTSVNERKWMTKCEFIQKSKDVLWSVKNLYLKIETLNEKLTEYRDWRRKQVYYLNDNECSKKDK